MLDIIQPIVVALIAGGFSVWGVSLSNRRQHAETQMQITNEINLIKKDIQELEKKQDKHNNLIERMYAVEKSVEVLEERQKVANHRLNDLEG